MKNNKFDVAIVGAGVVGASIARNLSKYKLKIALLEKEEDVSFGTSKANSGIIHGGFHHNKKFLKARLEIDGADLFDKLHRELSFPFKRCGIIVAAMHLDEMGVVEHLYNQGLENLSTGIELCSRQRMLDLEPKLSKDVVGGLYAPVGGIIEPYRFVFSLIENATQNGVKLFTNFCVDNASQISKEIEKEDLWKVNSKDGRTIYSRYVVNSAGLFADKVSKIFNAEEFTIKARKGEYFLLNRLAKGKPSRVVFPVPSPVSKGMLVIPTVEDTSLIGPTADLVDDKEELSTTTENLSLIINSAKTLIPSISETDVITNFAGLRPVLDEDFYIEASKKAKNFVQVAGIQSPGLTAAPAIAVYVKNILLKSGLNLVENPNYSPKIKKPIIVRELSFEERQDLIKTNPAYGNIICRCEEVSEQEIVDAIHKGHTTLDGIKFYTRAQMGQCQGGFCSFKILKIIMRETGLSIKEITKRGGNSYVVEGEL